MTLELLGSSFYASSSMAQGDHADLLPLLIGHGYAGTRRLYPAVTDFGFCAVLIVTITSIS